MAAEGSSSAMQVDQEPTIGPPSNAPLDMSWRFLEAGVNRMMKRLSTGMSYSYYMLLYTTCYNYCVLNKAPETTATYAANRTGANLMGADLYNKLTEYFKEHLQELSRESQGLSDIALLQFYEQEWKRYTSGATYVHRLFTYLNRHWVKREKDEGRKGIYQVYTLALIQWREHFFVNIGGNGTGDNRLVLAILQQIKEHRDGTAIQYQLIKNVTDSMVALGIDENESQSSRANLDLYKNHFQNRFMEATEKYYRDESISYLAAHSVSEYIRKAEGRLQEEEERVDQYLHSTTKKTLILRCEMVLIAEHREKLQKEFQAFLEGDKMDDLQAIWGLLSRIQGGLDPLRLQFEEYVKKSGLAEAQRVSNGCINDKGKVEGLEPKVYIQGLIDVYKKNANVVEKAFRAEQGFTAALDKACSSYCNSNVVTQAGGRTPELLANYIHTMLSKSNKESGDESMEDALNDAMIIFKYIDDKDIFQKFYRQNLANRLVKQQSSSDEAEASMISKLKEACGFEYTIKLTKMMTDVNLSNDQVATFKEKMQQTHDASELEIDFSVIVGGSNNWPLVAQDTDFAIPKPMQPVIDRFSRFYANSHTGRKLKWLWHLHRVEIRTNWTKQKYILMASGYQAAVLLLFNDVQEPSLTYEEIKTATKLEDKQLKAVMGILTKCKLLNLLDDTYSLNLKFSSKKIRININTTIKADAKAEATGVLKAVEEDRKFIYQAQVVRLMKARHQLSHQGLINEVTNMLTKSFTPKVSEIKKAIDTLLDKEYIERVEGSKDLYNYLA